MDEAANTYYNNTLTVTYSESSTEVNIAKQSIELLMEASKMIADNDSKVKDTFTRLFDLIQ